MTHYLIVSVKRNHVYPLGRFHRRIAQIRELHWSIQEHLRALKCS